MFLPGARGKRRKVRLVQRRQTGVQLDARRARAALQLLCRRAPPGGERLPRAARLRPVRVGQRVRLQLLMVTDGDPLHRVADYTEGVLYFRRIWNAALLYKVPDRPVYVEGVLPRCPY